MDNRFEVLCKGERTIENATIDKAAVIAMILKSVLERRPFCSMVYAEVDCEENIGGSEIGMEKKRHSKPLQRYELTYSWPYRVLKQY